MLHFFVKTEGCTKCIFVCPLFHIFLAYDTENKIETFYDREFLKVLFNKITVFTDSYIESDVTTGYKA